MNKEFPQGAVNEKEVEPDHSMSRESLDELVGQEVRLMFQSDRSRIKGTLEKDGDTYVLKGMNDEGGSVAIEFEASETRRWKTKGGSDPSPTIGLSR